MALEKTVLDDEKIKKLLSENWGISLVSCKKLKLGTANCYIVSDLENQYFLKEFQSDMDKNDIVREAGLVLYLYERGIPTAKYITTLCGDICVKYRRHFICLEEYVSGITYEYNDFPEKFLPDLACLLAKIHRTLKGYDLPADMDEKWLSSISADEVKGKYEKLFMELECHKEDKYYEKIKKDLVYKQNLIEKGEQLKKHFEGITYCATHGDYQGCQVICEKESIKAIIDFSSARTLPVVWEIMRSFVQSSNTCRHNAKIDVEQLCEYVKKYMEFAHLSKADLYAMPYVYLYQLSRSSYGYPQYLQGVSEDREGLLQFAFWRTDICREVEKKAESIVKLLVEKLNTNKF